MDSLLVTAESRVAMPCATAPMSAGEPPLTIGVKPSGSEPELSGSTSAAPKKTRRPSVSVDPAVKPGHSTVVSAVLLDARVADAPIGLAASNSPAGTRIHVPVRCSDADGLKFIEPDVQAAVHTTYHACIRISVLAEATGPSMDVRVSPFCPEGGVTEVVVVPSSQAMLKISRSPIPVAG